MRSNSILIIVVVLVGVSLFWLFRPGQSVPEVRNDTIVFFGDSLVAGYGATANNGVVDQLSAQLEKPIINAGVSGDTTTDGLARLDAVLAHDPGLTIILLGGNDALRKHPIEETEANLRQIIETLQANGSAVVLVGIRSGLIGDRYDTMFETLRDEYDLLYVPDALRGLIGRTEYMTDAIHPNDAGYAMLAERIYEVVAPIYE